MQQKDMISGLFFLLVGILFSMAAVGLPLGTFSNPGPGMVPLFPGALLIILSSVLVFRSYLQRSKQAEREQPSPESCSPTAFHPMVIITLAVMLLYAFGIELLGFIIASVLLMLFMFKFGGQLNWRKTIIGTVLSVGICYLVFRVWLEVQFPRGPWGF